MNNAPGKPPADPAVELLGVRVHRLAWNDLKAGIAEAAENNRHWIIANHNLHSVYLYHHDPEVRTFYSKAAYAYIDGMPLVFLGQLLGLALTRRNRLTPLDWVRPLCAEAARRGWQIFYLGSKPEVAERGARRLREEFPGLRIETAHGYFDARPDSEENRAVVEVVNRCRPHLLMVGMGMPRQEKWIMQNFEKVDARAVFNVGALMDYVAGEIPTPPRWAGQIGLEWLFRLLSQPRHLWRRYLIEPWFALRLFVADCVRRNRSGHSG